MKRRLGPDAFTYYVSLGPDRSYHAVAEFFRVDKRTVLRRAKEEQWQTKLVELERKAQANVQQKIVTSLEEMNERHLKILRVVLSKAVDTLRSMPLRSASDAVKAIDICVKHERVILGEPSERSDVAVESIIKREYDRWLLRPGEEPDDDGPSATASGSIPVPRVEVPPDTGPRSRITYEDDEDDRRRRPCRELNA